MPDFPPRQPENAPYSSPEIGAIAHLYRGELYRSKVWRARLDGTTNWAVGTTGIGLSAAFSNREHPALTLILVGLLVLIFLIIESRRYRYFDIWRTRVRLLEVCFYGPILRGQGLNTQSGWNQVLASDYNSLRFHISFWEAFGRRLRRNYAWIFAIVGVSFLVKLAIHPEQATRLENLWERATIGPLSGHVVILTGSLFYLALFAVGFLTSRRAAAAGRVHGPEDTDPILKFGLKV